MLHIPMVVVFRVIKHFFNKIIYIKELFNNFHAIMPQNCKTHLVAIK